MFERSVFRSALSMGDAVTLRSTPFFIFFSKIFEKGAAGGVRKARNPLRLRGFRAFMAMENISFSGGHKGFMGGEKCRIRP